MVSLPISARSGWLGTPVHQRERVVDAFHLRSSVGFSFFWDTPIGPLKFNFAQAIRKEDYDLEQVFDLSVATDF